MKTLIILRPEIFSVMIMICLIGYDRYCIKYRSEKDNYFNFALACLGHCVFALITEITVNIAGTPVWLNNICHILFFLFSILCSLFYFEYVLNLIIPDSKWKNVIMIIGYVLCALVVIATFLSPIEYIQGKYTRYSAGTGPALCYMLGFLLFLAADIVLIVNRRRIYRSTIIVLIPLSFVALGLLTIQIIVPEFLYTAQALTLTAVGLFLAIENPLEKFRNKAFFDFDMNIWNRICYEYDVEHDIAESVKAGHRISCVIGDLNGLNAVNDNFGRSEGDKLLARVANIWKAEMKSAYKCYRIGGDEFLAVYFDCPANKVELETDAVKDFCNKIHMGNNIPIGISIGFAEMSKGGNYNATFKKAENMLLDNKKQYFVGNGFDRRTR